MQIKFDEYLDLFKQLIRHPSVVGAEQSLFRIIQNELKEIGIATSQFEGLLVAEGSQPDSHYLSAHIDRHGLICTGPEEFQYASLVIRHRDTSNGKPIPEKAIRTISNRFKNRPMLAYEPWTGNYLGSGQVSDSEYNREQNNIIFQVNGLEHVPAGTPVAYQDKLSTNNGYLTGQIDNIITVAAMIHLYRIGYQGIAFFTAMEEAGKSWQFLMEWFQHRNKRTHRLVVLDTTPFPERADADAQDIVLRHRDLHDHYNEETVRTLKSTCEKLDKSYVFKDEWVDEQNRNRKAENKQLISIGSTELGKLISESKGRIQGATLQIPTIGYHTPDETASVKSTRAFLEVLTQFSLNN